MEGVSRALLLASQESILKLSQQISWRRFFVSSAAQYPHIVVDDSGTALLDRTRYKVVHLAAEHYHHGWSAEELLRQHPDLRPEQVYSALGYFYDHYDEIVARLEASARTAWIESDSRAMSRDELLKRSTGKP